MIQSSSNTEGIAIVGMAGRFPGAKNLAEFWRNLCDGVESISFFTDEEMVEGKVNLLKNDPRYVKARGILAEASLFDAAFFGMTPKEASITDPQHRIFLECAWEALENAGHDPEQFDGPIGVFAGMSMNTYLGANLHGHTDLLASLSPHQVMLANDKDFLPTRVSYKLNLKGPSLNVQTACSTSLVAVCVACQSLLDYQCDMALAGGVSIQFPQKQGHLHQDGGIGSPDGHCRAFDARAAGTVSGEGAGIVVLRRLADALADGDTIYAVIKGFALNNDGANKIGYTAPSVQGQAEVIAAAQAMADFPPDTISYVEAHGTGTPLGDPIEIEGLTKAFRARTHAKGFCAIGSLKTNIGHLDAAAGVAGLIKTVLAMHNRQIPPSLHFEQPNPLIDFANSPFCVVRQLTDWKPGELPRRAGVSSFGIGGTNAHVVLEEAPSYKPPSPSHVPQLIVLSAKTAPALDMATANLAAYLKQHPETNLADVAHTLQKGRRAFSHRRMLVCADTHEAVRTLIASDTKNISTGTVAGENPPIVFMFPGQGAQHVNMGRELYELEPDFRADIKLCSDILRPLIGFDLCAVLYPENALAAEAQRQLTQTRLTQPALFTIEYALARLLMRWGVRPAAMIGHSIGEYVAACLAGVFSLEDALKLVAERANLMQDQPHGAMLAVRLPASEVQQLLGSQLSLAAVNAPLLCVVSGPVHAIETLQKQLEAREVGCRLLQTSHAFHSAMMEPIVQSFAGLVKKFSLKPPRIPYLSNVTGQWITEAEAIDPDYWARHLRHTVRFSDGAVELLKSADRVFVEVGPGQTLSNLIRQQPGHRPATRVWSSLPSATDSSSALKVLLSTLGHLWLAGQKVNWTELRFGRQPRRIPLPTYPFERKLHWIPPVKTGIAQLSDAANEEALHPQQFHLAPACRCEPAQAMDDHHGRAVSKDGLDHKDKQENRVLAELRSLFQSISGQDLAHTGPSTTFLELGFDSLLLTQASLALEKKFGVRIAFRKLLGELSTLEALGAHIAEGEQPAQTVPASGRNVIERVERTRPADDKETDRPATQQPADGSRTITVPLTEAQRELWFAGQLGEGAACVANETRLIHLHGPLQMAALQAAVKALTDRHEALRASISASGTDQQIAPVVSMQMPFTDLSQLSQAEREKRLGEWLAREAERPFDLAQPPLARLHLLKFEEGRHLLIFTIHHLVCDGHSFGVLLYDLSRFYSAECRGETAELPEPLQLSTYAQQQDRLQQSPEQIAAEAWWIRQFSDDAPLLELPTDRPRPSNWRFEGAHASREINTHLARQLKQVSSKHNSTLFTTLLASFIILLRRLSNQDDIVVGIPVADRDMAGSEALAGHCINFLPLRTHLKQDATITEFAGTIKHLFLEAYENRHCTFGRLIQKLNIRRDQGRMPLVSVSFNMDRFLLPPDFSGLDLDITASPHSCTNFDLSFNVMETGGVLQLDCRYSTALFDPSTMQRWLGHYETILQGMVETPAQNLVRLSLLSPAQQQQLLHEWNDTQAGYPCELCVQQLFENQAERTPDAVAAVIGDRSLTYGQLNRQANLLARQLQTLGVGPDVSVGICMERSLEMVVAVLAVLKSGGAYVPLDSSYPSERLRLMLHNAQAPLVLTRRSLCIRLGNDGIDCPLVCVDQLPHDAAETKETVNLQSSATPENLAYIIHTSGSTGVPKGVAMPHRALVNLIAWQVRNSPLGGGARTLQFASLSFDVSFQEIFSTWCSGGTLVLVDEEFRRDPVKLFRFVQEQRIERLFLPFVALQQMAEAFDEKTPVPSALREVITAGEQLQITPQIRSLFNRLPSCTLQNQYGPSESHVVTVFTLQGAPSEWPLLPPIGRPIANAQIYILDAQLQPVPVGVPGELHIGGDCLARGYLNQPELTAERFINNPWEHRMSPKLYKTGDLARWLADGSIEFLGRRDNQTKIRGYRIELGEVESVLAQHPAVRECAVAVHKSTSGDRHLTAYIVTGSDETTVSGELRQFLKTKLPDYMLPALFICLDRLPLTPSGKVDRLALVPPERKPAEADEHFIAPITPVQQTLAAMWQDLLGVERVGIHTSFFDLGGHSLLATRFISLVRDEYQVELPMSCLFQTPTIAELALTIEELLVTAIDSLSDEEARQTVGKA